MIKNVNLCIFFYSFFFLFLVLEGVVQYFLQSVNGETTEVDFRLQHVSILYCYTISRF